MLLRICSMSYISFKMQWCNFHTQKRIIGKYVCNLKSLKLRLSSVFTHVELRGFASLFYWSSGICLLLGLSSQVFVIFLFILTEFWDFKFQIPGPWKRSFRYCNYRHGIRFTIWCCYCYFADELPETVKVEVIMTRLNKFTHCDDIWRHKASTTMLLATYLLYLSLPLVWQLLRWPVENIRCNEWSRLHKGVTPVYNIQHIIVNNFTKISAGAL